MMPLLVYLLKMLVCSGILFGYYRLALYNERFHQWNRFYLLVALGVSVIVPFAEINWHAQSTPPAVAYVLTALPWHSTPAHSNFHFTKDAVVLLFLALISIAFVIRFIRGIAAILKLYQHGSVTKQDAIDFVVTPSSAAPFSFFKWLFWQENMDPASEQGQRILQHELTHIQQKHSIDKLFAELLLIVFWMNPFFWLIKRELHMIHEFLADRTSLGNEGGAAFAAMLLQQLSFQQPSSITNPFFTSQIKRRLIMITTSNQPHFSYLRRIAGLCTMVLVSFMIMLSAKNALAQQTNNLTIEKLEGTIATTESNLPDSILSIEFSKGKPQGAQTVTLFMRTGQVLTMSLDDARKRFSFGPKHFVNKMIDSLHSFGEDVQVSIKIANDHLPLYIYAGIEITADQMKSISPNQIESIDVIKGEKAIKTYGEKAKYGVVKITPKLQDFSEKTIPVPNQDDPRINGERKTGYVEKIWITPSKDEHTAMIVDGKLVSKMALQELNADNIASIEILKDSMKLKQYGLQVKQNIILITTKNGKGAQQTPTNDKVFTKTEVPAQFLGGEAAWNQYVQKHFKNPTQTLQNANKGSIQLQFNVQPDGSITDVKVMNNPGQDLTEAAIRLVTQSPKWNPAEQNGKKVTAQVVKEIVY